MSDVLDRANETERLNSEIALRNQQQRAKQTLDSLYIDGKRCCVDCDEPILDKRLEASPDAVRCVWCQQDFELKGKRSVTGG